MKMNALLRDLKPDNVVLDADCQVAKLTDFGLGRFGAEVNAGEGWTFGCPPGSPGYIAPEVLRQEKYNASADLYSFGVLVWVLLTGGVTFDAKPRPPYNPTSVAASRMGDYRANRDDWRSLQDAIARPEKAGARPLPSDAGPLVEGLIQRQAHLRPKHADIRRSEYFKALRIPSPDAPREDVESWIDTKWIEAPSYSASYGYNASYG
jgi:serine/threonine protein kinase